MAVYKPENEALMQSDLLPPCDGPKLPAFKHRFEPIEWLERLDDPEESRRGHVFRVKIRGQEYALKVVSILSRMRFQGVRKLMLT